MFTRLFCCEGSGGLECPGPGDVTPLLRLEMEDVGVRREEGVGANVREMAFAA